MEEFHSAKQRGKHLGLEADCEISLKAELKLALRFKVVQISQHFDPK